MDATGQAKVTNLEVAVGVDQEVGRLGGREGGRGGGLSEGESNGGRERGRGWHIP